MKIIILLVLFFFVLSPAYVFAALEEGATITVETKLSSYEKGSTIDISGLISNYDESDPIQVYQIALRIIDPKNNIVTISQIIPNSGGTYSTSILTDGPMWKSGGDYTVIVNYASDKASTTFSFIVPEVEAKVEVKVEAEAEVETEAEVEDISEKCGEGTHLEDGVCVLDEIVSAESTSGETASTFNSWMHSITFTILIAFVIMIILYLISRVRGKKTV